MTSDFHPFRRNNEHDCKIIAKAMQAKI